MMGVRGKAGAKEAVTKTVVKANSVEEDEALLIEAAMLEKIKNKWRDPAQMSTPLGQKYARFAQKAHQLCESDDFNNFIIICIMIAGLNVGVQTYLPDCDTDEECQIKTRTPSSEYWTYRCAKMTDDIVLYIFTFEVRSRREKKTEPRKLSASEFVSRVARSVGVVVKLGGIAHRTASRHSGFLSALEKTPRSEFPSSSSSSSPPRGGSNHPTARNTPRQTVAKIVAEGWRPLRFFTGDEWKWNNFDFVIVFCCMPFMRPYLGTQARRVAPRRAARVDSSPAPSRRRARCIATHERCFRITHTLRTTGATTRECVATPRPSPGDAVRGVVSRAKTTQHNVLANERRRVASLAL